MGQQRLYEFCFLLPFDLWTSYLARILFLQGYGSLFWESPSSTRIFNGLQYSFQVWQGYDLVCRTLCVCVCVCVGEKISLPWFSKELKTTYWRTTSFMASSLYLSFANQYSLGGAFPFLVVLVLRYKLSLCHTTIKPDLLGFPGIGVFACGLRDHVITRFASFGIIARLWNKVISFCYFHFF